MTAQSVSRPVFPAGRGPALDLWDAVAELIAWFDESTAKRTRWWWSPSRRRAHRAHDLTLRIVKCSEEVGEVVEARIGMLGQNPRKGHSHTREDVAGELCDVIVTAAVALGSLTSPDEARDRLNSKLTALLARAGRTPAEVTS